MNIENKIIYDVSIIWSNIFGIKNSFYFSLFIREYIEYYISNYVFNIISKFIKNEVVIELQDEN